MLKEFDSRPALILTLALALGIATAQIWWIGFIAFALCLFPSKNLYKSLALLCVGFGFIFGPRAPSPIPSTQLINETFWVVQSPKPTPYGEKCTVTGASGTYILYHQPGDGIELGSKLLINGYAKPFSSKQWETYRFQGVRGTLSPRGKIVHISNGLTIAKLGDDLRHNFANICINRLPSQEASLLRALCFNDDGSLDKEARSNLSRAGVIHIISTSGLHVSLIAGFITWILARLPIPRGIQLMLLFSALIIMAAGAGFRPPMIRSVVMAMLFYSAYLWKRENDTLNAIAISAMIVLLLVPSALYDLGFQLSFVTTIALLFSLNSDQQPSIKLIDRFKDHSNNNFKTSLFATLGAAPLLAYHFGSVSIIGCLTNVLIIPLIPWIVSLGFVAAGVVGLSPAMADLIFTRLVQPLLWILERIVDIAAAVPFASISVPSFHPIFVLLLYCFLGMLVEFKRSPAPEAVSRETSERATST